MQIINFQLTVAKIILLGIIINMRISSIQNFRYNTPRNNIRFEASNAASMDSSGGNNEDNRPKPLPNWARKAMLGTLVVITLKNDSVVQSWFKSEPTQEELDKIEYYDDIQKVRKEKGVSTAFYHLNKLNDIEQPKVKALGDGKYQLDFELDDRRVWMDIRLDENNKDTINGRVKINGMPSAKFKAVFPSEDKDEFKVMLLDKENKKYIFGRDFSGELYKVSNGKKYPLNLKNVEKYEQYMQELETLDDFSFFTDANPMWRNLNYIILIMLFFAEAKYDSDKRKQRENEDNNKREF